MATEQWRASSRETLLALLTAAGVVCGLSGAWLLVQAARLGGGGGPAPTPITLTPPAACSRAAPIADKLLLIGVREDRPQAAGPALAVWLLCLSATPQQVSLTGLPPALWLAEEEMRLGELYASAERALAAHRLADAVGALLGLEAPQAAVLDVDGVTLLVNALWALNDADTQYGAQIVEYLLADEDPLAALARQASVAQALEEHFRELTPEQQTTFAARVPMLFAANGWSTLPEADTSALMRTYLSSTTTFIVEPPLAWAVFTAPDGRPAARPAP